MNCIRPGKLSVRQGNISLQHDRFVIQHGKVIVVCNDPLVGSSRIQERLLGGSNKCPQLRIPSLNAFTQNFGGQAEATLAVGHVLPQNRNYGKNNMRHPPSARLDGVCGCVCVPAGMKMRHPPPKPEDTHPTNSGKCVVVDLFLALTTRLGTIRSNIIVEGRRLFIGSEGGCFFDLLEEEVATRGHRQVFK